MTQTKTSEHPTHVGLKGESNIGPQGCKMMDKQDLIDWIKEQLYVGKRFKAEEEEEVERLYRTLDRFCTYLREEHSIEHIEGTTLDALRRFEFNYLENDDQHLRVVFSHLGRNELTEFLGMVSADKYFRNKKLTVIFKAMDDLKVYVKSLRKIDIRMASVLLERGAAPQGRMQLTEATGVPAEVLLKMVQCCDLCRMTGMAGQTLRRSFAMGYNTLEKFRATTPEQVEAEFGEYLRMSGERTNRMVSFSSFVYQARKLEDVVTY